MSPPLPRAAGEVVLYLGLRGEGASCRLIDVAVAGPGAERFADLDGRPFLGPWDPRLPPTRAVGRLRRSEPGECQLADEELPARGGLDELRWLIQDGDRLIGWLSWVAVESPFSKKDEARIGALAPGAASAVARWARDALQRTGRRWNVLFQPDGQLDAASQGVSSWLTPAEAAAMGAWVVEHHDGRAGTHAHIKGLPCELVRLDGPTPRYLVQALVPAAPRLDPLWVLSAQQRKVVDLASFGATVDEVARSLSLAPPTVKRHLKDAYKTLGVANRAEVARLRWER
jgi:DNA-binding CsgD family transcriptional regulator